MTVHSTEAATQLLTLLGLVIAVAAFVHLLRWLFWQTRGGPESGRGPTLWASLLVGVFLATLLHTLARSTTPPPEGIAHERRIEVACGRSTLDAAAKDVVSRITSPAFLARVRELARVDEPASRLIMPEPLTVALEGDASASALVATLRQPEQPSPQQGRFRDTAFTLIDWELGRALAQQEDDTLRLEGIRLLDRTIGIAPSRLPPEVLASFYALARARIGELEQEEHDPGLKRRLEQLLERVPQ